MSTDTASQRKEWLHIYNSAKLDYQVTLGTARALPVAQAIKFADQLYADLHFADQMRRKAARMLEG